MTVFAVTVTFRLHAGRAAAFLPLVRENARASVTDEPGCLRFDVCLPEGDDGHQVFLYELYRNRAAFDAHLASGHYKAFAEASRDMVAEKRAAFLLAEPTP